MPTIAMPTMNARYARRKITSVHLRFLFIFSYVQGVSLWLVPGGEEGSVHGCDDKNEKLWQKKYHPNPTPTRVPRVRNVERAERTSPGQFDSLARLNARVPPRAASGVRRGWFVARTEVSRRESDQTRGADRSAAARGRAPPRCCHSIRRPRE